MPVLIRNISKFIYSKSYHDDHEGNLTTIWRFFKWFTFSYKRPTWKERQTIERETWLPDKKVFQKEIWLDGVRVIKKEWEEVIDPSYLDYKVQELLKQKLYGKEKISCQS